MNRLDGIPAATLLAAVMPFASAVAVMAADDPPTTKAAAPAGASSKSVRTPMIVRNPWHRIA